MNFEFFFFLSSVLILLLFVLKIRKEQNLTQKNLSSMVNIHRSYYSMIERGRKNPSLRVAISIKKALNYQYDDIFEKQ